MNIIISIVLMVLGFIFFSSMKSSSGEHKVKKIAYGLVSSGFIFMSVLNFLLIIESSMS